MSAESSSLMLSPRPRWNETKGIKTGEVSAKMNIEKSDLAILHKAFYMMDTERTGLIAKKTFARALKDNPEIIAAFEQSRAFRILLKMSIVASLMNFKTNNAERWISRNFSKLSKHCP